MNVSLISFGKKIPVSACKVKDLRTGKFVPVKMYEYDCLDQSDIDEVQSLPDSFNYKTSILKEMSAKKIAKEKYFLDTGVSHYVMQTKEGETLGIASLQKMMNLGALNFFRHLSIQVISILVRQC